MFVDMITPGLQEKSNLGVSISRPTSAGVGWCKAKPISIAEVRIANDETHFMLDVSFMMYMRSNIFSSNLECTLYFYVHSLNFHIDDIISVQSMIFCIVYIFIPYRVFSRLMLWSRGKYITPPKIILPIFTHIWQFILSLLSYFVCNVSVSSSALSRGNHYFLILKNGVVEQLVHVFRSRTLLSHRRFHMDKSLKNSIS